MFNKIIKYLRTQEWDYECLDCGHTYSTKGWGRCIKCHSIFIKELGPSKKNKRDDN